VLGTQRLEEPDRFAAKFEQLMASVRSERVVIAIDNLDRCSPDRAVEILSTIKTCLEPAIEPDSARRWLPPLRAHGQAPKPAVFLIAAAHRIWGLVCCPRRSRSLSGIRGRYGRQTWRWQAVRANMSNTTILMGYADSRA
jgi:hypothetical protein